MVDLAKKPLGPRLAGVMAKIWSGGAGPAHSAIDSSLVIAGLDPDEYPGTKEVKVRNVLLRADDETARNLAQELIDLLRTEGIFEIDDDVLKHRIGMVQKAFEPDATLSSLGVLTWHSQGEAKSSKVGALNAAPPVLHTGSQWAASMGSPRANATTEETAVSAGPSDIPETETIGPSLGFMMEVLRRVPEAARPLVGGRRKTQTSVRVVDEYDVQDFVHQALRLLYPDTRAEEPMPSYAGASARTDFLVKAESTVVEVKVTRENRGEKPIRDEIIIDQRVYQKHPNADYLIAVVYDLVGNFKNPAGFEQDLSTTIDGLRCKTLVVRWPSMV